MRRLVILISLAFLMMQCGPCEQEPVVTDRMEPIRQLLANPPPPPIQNWEYEICNGFMDFHSLNSYGERGWELVSHSQVLVHTGRGGTEVRNAYVFKRPLQ